MVCHWLGRSDDQDLGNGNGNIEAHADGSHRTGPSSERLARLTIHILSLQVTGLAISARHPYMFSSGLDKKVMCWDLEANKVRKREAHF